MGHKYDYEINLGDGSAPDHVVRMVGREKRVLDIGAGPGSIARILNRQFDCHVTAVETDETAIERLMSACERIYRVNLNEDSWPEALRDAGTFDVVVVADVLEHLYDPWTALTRMKDLINKDGHIVISLPHAGYNGMLACLLNDDFQYRESGLMDRTHIRFFGIKNIQALLDNAGLAITDAEFVIRHPENTEFAEIWGGTPAQTRTNLLRNKFGLVYQAVVKAVPVSSSQPRISLLELGEDKPSRDATHSTIPERHGKSERASERTAIARADKPSRDKIRVIAFFLTQFHPIPENDRWWGKGFTEWTNVTRAEPLFEGHYQPHLPADLGFYDLRLRETRHEQIAMARQYGIDGFCYHYYWFSGTRILNRPLDDMLSDPESDMPFCLCWANEHWTRRWDGMDHEVLLRQKYLPEDDLNFIKSVVPFFHDPRYIRHDSAPFLIVYQPQHLPDPLNSVKLWREYCETAGIGHIHLCAALTNDNEDYARFGFDSGMQFPPHNHKCTHVNEQIDFYAPFHGDAVEYGTLARSYLDREYPKENVFRTVSPSWDQTPRVGPRGFLTLNATPANYEYWLGESIRRTVTDYPGKERFVFVNAWNEWAEGCHLEPDLQFGRQFLEATSRAKAGESTKSAFEDFGQPTVSGPVKGWMVRLAELKRELTVEQEELSAVYQDLSAKRKQLAATTEELSVEREQLKEAERKLLAQQQRLAEADQALSAMHGSRSWRLTHPLREALVLLRGRK